MCHATRCRRLKGLDGSFFMLVVGLGHAAGLGRYVSFILHLTQAKSSLRIAFYISHVYNLTRVRYISIEARLIARGTSCTRF
jgi:hypothetical protein